MEKGLLGDTLSRDNWVETEMSIAPGEERASLHGNLGTTPWHHYSQEG